MRIADGGAPVAVNWSIELRRPLKNVTFFCSVLKPEQQTVNASGVLSDIQSNISVRQIIIDVLN
jgi:hypothetical protein